jgi:hypothetical protein
MTTQTTQTIQDLIQQIFIKKTGSPKYIRTLAFHLTEDLKSINDSSHYYPNKWYSYGVGLGLHISHYNTTQGDSWFIDLHIYGEEGFYVRFCLSRIYSQFFTQSDLNPSDRDTLLLEELRDEIVKLMGLR